MLLSLYGFFVVLQLLDAYTTHRVIERGGRELNPLLLKLNVFLRQFTNAKWAWLITAKLLAIGAGWVVYSSGEPYAVYVLGFLCALYAVVVVHNFKEMEK